jgi:hypothetical protein
LVVVVQPALEQALAHQELEAMAVQQQVLEPLPQAVVVVENILKLKVAQAEVVAAAEYPTVREPLILIEAEDQLETV